MINIEYKKENSFPVFLKKISGKRVAVLCDLNTKKYANGIIKLLNSAACGTVEAYFPLSDLVPNEDIIQRSLELAKDCDYVLAVGSGSLNDTAKAVSYELGIECGVLATAASMDGYCSVGAAVMQNGFKVTLSTHTPSDILIDLDIVKTAPREMTAAGFGDILGKFTCLTDWRLSAAVTGEEVDEEAYSMMEKARSDCFEAYDGLVLGESDATAKLMDALIAAGLSMAKCGNSRPASGSEHHISHYLEMDFVRRKLPVPLHGVKVAIGTLVSIEIYNALASSDEEFAGKAELQRLAAELPSQDKLKEILGSLGCPTRFSEIGVSRELFEETVLNAHTVRDRFTVLTLSDKLGYTRRILPLLTEKYW